MVLPSKPESRLATNRGIDDKSDARTHRTRKHCVRNAEERFPNFAKALECVRVPTSLLDGRQGDYDRKLLAQRPAPSEDRCAMNSSARSQGCARAIVAAVLFAAFSWTLLVGVSPRLHGCIHADANRSDHVCAITLITSGSYEHAGQPPLVSRPQFNLRFHASTALTFTWVKPLFLNAHIFAHAPPALV
jgi:hypothetical protein